MDGKSYRTPLVTDTRVRTASPLTACREYDGDMQDERRAGVVGWVGKEWSDARGLCYNVRHMDGGSAWYNHDELEPLPGGILNGRRVYLSGPIENDTSGIDWRPPVKQQLKEEFGLKVFDPFADPKQNMVGDIAMARAEKDLDGIRRVGERFVWADLSIVDHSDIVIARVPKGVPTYGTTHEIINANEQKKPVILVCPEGPEWLPSWLIGFCPLRMMFGSFEEVFDYLRRVDSGQMHDDRRWWFVYNYYRDEWMN